MGRSVLYVCVCHLTARDAETVRRSSVSFDPVLLPRTQVYLDKYILTATYATLGTGDKLYERCGTRCLPILTATSRFLLCFFVKMGPSRIAPECDPEVCTLQYFYIYHVNKLKSSGIKSGGCVNIISWISIF